MKRFAATVAIALMLWAVALPSTATAQTCGDLFGIARLQASGAGTAQGQALVFFDGTAQSVQISSTLISPTEGVQDWAFAQGAVTVHESATPTPIGGGLLSINSTVEVISAGDSGDWTYLGIFNTNTNIARFVVTGTLCIG